MSEPVKLNEDQFRYLARIWEEIRDEMHEMNETLNALGQAMTEGSDEDEDEEEEDDE